MIFRSKDRLTSVYHRLVLGMSIGDIIWSLAGSTFQVMAPSEMNYMIWSAQGNQATCDALGFMVSISATTGILYSCSINIHCLASVKYNMSEEYLASRLEKFLHGVPIACALVRGITLLVMKNFNAPNGCITATYDPPHCKGVEDGEVREGFDIPCGRGRDGAPTFAYVSRLILFLVPPVIVITSLLMIYRYVRQQERQMARYGQGALERSSNRTSITSSGENNTEGGESRQGRLSSIGASVLGSLRQLSSSMSMEETTQQSFSQSVLHRALAYSISYFLGWSPVIILTIIQLADAWRMPMATWQLVFVYIWNILNPLQGFFNFIVFMLPTVTKKRRLQEGGGSWCRAFAEAFWAGIASD